NGGNQILGGSGSVLFGISAANTLWTGETAGTNLTIGPNILIHGQNGVVGSNATNFAGFTDGAFINQGTISADVSGGTIRLGGTIDGGTIVTTGSNALIATNNGGLLKNAVTLNGTLDVTTASSANVSVTGGLMLGGTMLIGSNTGSFGYVSFSGGNQTLGGSG